eukprot:5949564-Pleurochrysis_carterae.AAC.1
MFACAGDVVAAGERRGGAAAVASRGQRPQSGTPPRRMRRTRRLAAHARAHFAAASTVGFCTIACAAQDLSATSEALVESRRQAT